VKGKKSFIQTNRKFPQSDPIKNQLISLLKVAPFKYTQFVSRMNSVGGMQWKHSVAEEKLWKRRKKDKKCINFTYLPFRFVFICCRFTLLRYNHVPPTLIEQPARFPLHRPASYLSRTPVCTSPIQMVQSLDCLSEISTRKRKKESII
jgi:hypothetical protein